MEIENYVREQNIIHAGNIDNYSIGEKVLDKDKTIALITNKSKSSIEVFIEARDKDNCFEKRKGVSASHWFLVKEFESRFKKI